MSSSKRGRKRNDNLPPNRARDVQRAFRARRAAHLQALEQRVAELEDENAYLRQSLHLPPANRPPLGRGPTGKDKPSGTDATDSAGSPFSSSRESSSLADSPPSRQSSNSPHNPIPVSMSPSDAMAVLDHSWGDSAMALSDAHPSPMLLNSHPYPVSPLAHPAPMKPVQFPPFTNAISSSSRQAGDGYSSQHADPFARSPDAGYTTQQFYSMRGDGVDRPTYIQFSGRTSPTFHHAQVSRPVPTTIRPFHQAQPTLGHIDLHQEQDHRSEISSHYTAQQANVHVHDYPQGTDYPMQFSSTSRPPSHMHSESRSHVAEYYTPRDPAFPTPSTTRSPYAPDGRTHPAVT